MQGGFDLPFISSFNWKYSLKVKVRFTEIVLYQEDEEQLDGYQLEKQLDRRGWGIRAFLTLLGMTAGCMVTGYMPRLRKPAEKDRGVSS
jgi:hypothetical protein